MDDKKVCVCNHEIVTVAFVEYENATENTLPASAAAAAGFQRR